eukprot:15358127-Ditylum_brightwellii.AAC.1
MFMKEEKNTTHFLQMQKRMLEVPPEKSNITPSTSSHELRGQNEGSVSLSVDPSIVHTTVIGSLTS